MTRHPDSFSSRATLTIGERSVQLFRLDALSGHGQADLRRLPFSIRVLLENLLRHEDGTTVTREDILAVASWDPAAQPATEIAFRPARVLLQDFTGVPAVVDLAAMREAVARMGGDPGRVNPLQPADLVIDHSVQVDTYGSLRSFADNVRMEFERNAERYRFLKWGQSAFKGLRVVPPGTGIVHQVNLEYLAPVVASRDEGGQVVLCPDTLVGTDSHTTMINALGVLGWGVGGIEAEAAMLGQPISMLVPQVVGFRLKGQLREGVTATDLVLRVVEMLRERGVVGRFVEFCGSGLDNLSLPDRATIANMAPEYGATMGFFPVDDEVLSYLRFTGRSEAQVQTVERYCKEQGLFRSGETPEPRFSELLELDLGDVTSSIAGPRRPQDRVALGEAKRAFRKSLVAFAGDRVAKPQDPAVQRWMQLEPSAPPPAPLDATVDVKSDGNELTLRHGDVVIAAITSCTNTSNPSVLMAAGLLAKKAVEQGLRAAPAVKTSLAPGSQVVSDYLEAAGLTDALQTLGFYLVGYGCTTCIGNSGPLSPPISQAIAQGELVAAAVLSGNRNFEGRINADVRANYLASPPLVVAYAIAGTMDIDLEREPLGTGNNGKPVYLRDVWPSQQEIRSVIRDTVRSEMFTARYGHVFEGPERWQQIEAPSGKTFAWQPDSTYIRKPPFFDHVEPGSPPPVEDIEGARVLVMAGDSVTTDHISPAGSIALDSPAARYLQEHGVAPRDFNSYGSRRGNHEVMMRGTFANIRLRNLLAPGTEGGVTRHLPDGEQLSVYDAAMKYAAEGVPLIVIAGKEYGTGSSRDWAAKGTQLLGVRAVIVESFERIHRSNLVGMGVLPLEFLPGDSREGLGLSGEERYSIEGVGGDLQPRKRLRVRADSKTFEAIARLDTPQEIEYYRHGGILNYVLRQLAG